MNDKTAHKKLEMLLAKGFTGRGRFVELTLQSADLLSRRAGTVKCVRQFLKNLCKYRAVRSQMLRYLNTTEEKHGKYN